MKAEFFETLETPSEIYLCLPMPLHKRIACFVCDDSNFGGPFVRFFVDRDMRMPVCTKCALKIGFVIERPDGRQVRCQRSKTGAIEFFPE
jgi:hypothetical protein